jgi:hypothetical protein
MSRMTTAQATVWRRWRAHDPGAPERFTAGRYVCPVHGGPRRDLSIRYLPEENRVALHCFDGCPHPAILARLGLRYADLSDYGGASGTLEGSYTYVDEDGAERLRVHRYTSPVDVRCERWRDGEWEWEPASKGPHLLYRLPAVVEAVATGEHVYVVEGERHADALLAAGAVATTTPHKHGRPWRTEHLERLRDGYITVVARRDEAGRKWARALLAGLAAVAADVRLVEPATSRAGAGAAEHLAAGFTTDDFAPLEAATPSGAEEAPLPMVARDEGATILEDVERAYRAYVAWASDHQAVAVTLWAAHTHAAEASDTTPYLAIESAEPESGKTRTLEVAEHLAARAWLLVEPSEAAMFRKIERDHPTILLDESDALWGAKADGREGLRALLNAGYRRGATVPRVVGDGAGMTVQDFPVYGPKALAGLAGKLPRTIASRSIPIRLQRRAKGEPIERFRARRAAAELDPLRLRLAAFLQLVAAELEAADPAIPEALSDRQADCWEPLLAIADAAGDDWPARARAAAVALHEHDPAADPGIGTLLLAHVRDAFLAGVDDELPTIVLLRALVERDDGPWGGWWGKEVDEGRAKGPAGRLAKSLKPFGIRPEQIWTGDGKTRGYRRAAFVDAWTRYLPPTDLEDGRTVERRSEALFDPEAEKANMPSDQATTVLPFSETVEGSVGAPGSVDPAAGGRDTRARCPRCELVAFFDPTTGYGRRRLAEGHLECGGPWDLAP